MYLHCPVCQAARDGDESLPERATWSASSNTSARGLYHSLTSRSCQNNEKREYISKDLQIKRHCEEMRGRVQSQEVCGPHGRPCPSVSRSKHAFGPHGRPSSVPLRDARPAARAALLRAEAPPAGQARPRAAQAALRRAQPWQPHGRPSCVPRLLRPARHVLGPHRRPSDVLWPRRPRGSAAGRTGGPPRCPAVAASAAAARSGLDRLATAAAAARLTACPASASS